MVKGVLESGKLGWIVLKNGAGIYIYATKSSDMRKMNGLNRFLNQTVVVTGTLRYAPEPTPVTTDLPEARAPEHFYFDVAEATVTRVSRSVSKTRSKGKKR